MATGDVTYSPDQPVYVSRQLFNPGKPELHPSVPGTVVAVDGGLIQVEVGGTILCLQDTRARRLGLLSPRP